MPKKKRQSNIRYNIQPSIVFFNIQNQQPQHCAICLKSHLRLINPCLCHSKFHEKCILRLIKKELERQQRRSDFIVINGAKCQYCKQAYRFQHSTKRQYSCHIFLKKINRNCCNRHTIVIVVLLVMLIASATILTRYDVFSAGSSNSGSAIYFVLVTVIIVLSLLVVLVISHFVQNYALYKQLVLLRVVEVIEQRSLFSESSDDYRISDDYKIIIRD